MAIIQPVPEFSDDALTTPPSGPFPEPPVRTAATSLPFGQLTWENFERLCHRLLLRGNGFDHAARYGRQGQAQQGIDLFARLAGRRYEVWQAKRYKKYTATDLRSAVASFLAGTWAAKTDRLILAVQASLDDVTLQDEIEKQTEALRGHGIGFSVLGGDDLVEALRPHQDLVLDFFGRAWVDAFYGAAADPILHDRLDGAEFARIRTQLADYYEVRFRSLDQGMATARHFGSDAPPRHLPLLQRYVLPDLFVQESGVQEGADPARRPSTPTPAAPMDEEESLRQGDASSREQTRRLSVADWLAEGDHFAVVADAGAGKTTLVRALALDLLRGQTLFPAYARRFGHCLPIVIPFARWARATADAGGEVGLKEMVAKTLQPLLTADIVGQINRAVDDRRVVLIVDGLDEWSAEQAARTTLNTLLTYVQVHDVPTVVSARPQGLRKIGVLPTTWRSAQLAPLSTLQQRALALIWFRHLTRTAEAKAELVEVMAAWEVDRFMRELGSDASLGNLAQSSLLFVGLMFLSARSVALPRNRVQALQSLVTLLVEVHPEERATAAGDVKARFEFAASPEVRESALAALAFASRRDGGDAGYPRRDAIRSIRDHLMEAEGYDPARALASAAELLAVNAETVGLIVEKAPEEVGFAHASLEELLSAVHVRSWPLPELLAFVAVKAGEPRWRNVLRNLVALSVRASEADEIINAIEGVELDALGDLSRRRLLADIAFSPSRIPPRTAKRLAHSALDIIDGFGAEAERVALVTSCLNALGDPLLGGEIEQRVRRWTPRRVSYPAELYGAIGTWPADDETWAALVAGLGDDERSAARRAAQAIAARFGNDPERATALRRLLRGDVVLGVAAAALEALVLGWPEEDLTAEIDAVGVAGSPLLEITALWARIRCGLAYDIWLERCLALVSFQSSLDYTEQEIAQQTLFEGWPDDHRVVDAALEALNFGQSPQSMERATAAGYLLQTKPGRPAVKEWILEQLRGDHAFILVHTNGWRLVVKHCQADPDIREATVKYILGSGLRYNENLFHPVIAEVHDRRLRDHALAMVRRTDRLNVYWSLLPLVRGWRADPDVQQLVSEVLAWADDRLGMVVNLLPDLYDDLTAARDRLLRVASGAANPRIDLIVGALSAVGSTGDDAEAVEALLPRILSAEAGPWEASQFYLVFASHSKVLEAAHRRLGKPDAPIAILTQAFPTDALTRERALRDAHSLPLGVRSVLVAACGIGADRHPVLRETLAAYWAKVDFQLRVQLSIDHHRLCRIEGDIEGIVDHLRVELDQRGMDAEDRRSAAFAGLVVLERLDAIPTGSEASSQVVVQSFAGGTSAALCSLIIEYWGELKQALGPDFADSTIKTRYETPAWPALSRYIAANLEARRDFLDWCASQDRIGVTALRSLSEFWPRSDVLRTHVVRGLEMREQGEPGEWLDLMVASAEIARDQFPADDLRLSVKDRFEKTRGIYPGLALAIIDPNEPALKRRTRTLREIAGDGRQWFAAVQIAARLDPPDELVAVIHGMAERDAWPGSERQVLMTSVLVARLGRDAAAASALAARLDGGLSPSALAASLSLLSSAGRLDAEGWALCQRRANEAFASTVPIAAFDIQRDQLRPLAHVLNDILLSQT